MSWDTAENAPPVGDVQQAAVEILEDLRARRGHAPESIARVLRRHPELTLEGRAIVVRGVYSVLRSDRLLDHLLAAASPSGLDETRMGLARWLARGVLDRTVRFATAQSFLPNVRWASLPQQVDNARRLADPVARLALLESLPDWLAQSLINQLGESAAFALAHALNAAAPQTIRVNRLRTDRSALALRLAGKGITAVETKISLDGLVIEGGTDLYRLPEFHEGCFEAQDEGSQLVSELVAPPPGGVIVDACAGAGGKTLHLGALLGGKGRIAAIGVGPSALRQLEELRRRAERAGLHNVQTFLVEDESMRRELATTRNLNVEAATSDQTIANFDMMAGDQAMTGIDMATGDEAMTGIGLATGDEAMTSDEAMISELAMAGSDPLTGTTTDPVPSDAAAFVVTASAAMPDPSISPALSEWPTSLPKWLGQADRVLIDAPCSGFGVLRRNPEARAKLDAEAIPRLAALQRAILERFLPFVKVGGRLIYATCSILQEENDEVVSGFLDAHPELVLMPAKEILGKERALRLGDGHVLRVDPHHHGTDGFFAAVFRRLG